MKDDAKIARLAREVLIAYCERGTADSHEKFESSNAAYTKTLRTMFEAIEVEGKA